MLLISVNFVSADAIDYDDDTDLDFIWVSATGSVHHYNIYVSINSNDYTFIETTPTNSYTLKGKNYQRYKIRVQAVDAIGNMGPMSDESNFVICKLSPWDVNSDGKVDMSDFNFVIDNFGKSIKKPLEYNPDVNSDSKVNILDIATIGLHYGKIYSSDYMR